MTRNNKAATSDTTAGSTLNVQATNTATSLDTITYTEGVPDNVRDDLKGLTTQQVKDTLETRRTPMVTVCMNLTSDFNKASVIRAHNAFLGNDIIIVGKRRFDRRGTVGTYHYETIKHTPNFMDVYSHLRGRGYTLIAVDNTPQFSPQSVYDTNIPRHAAFIYGEEQKGLSEDVVALCDMVVYIPQYGSVRSINVAQAAAVMMSEYNRRHRP